jgi:hypothetical protein
MSNVTKNEDIHSIPFKYVTDDDLPDEWSYIYDFFHGFGYRRRSKVIYLRDVERFLKITDLRGMDLDVVYEQLQVPLEEHQQGTSFQA